MVIGKGLVAKRFSSFLNQDDCLVFASGVSNSKTKNPEEYKREFDLLKNCLQQHPDKSLIYFSTCSIYDPQEKESAYVMHKLQIEKYIMEHTKRYNIFRVSNLAGISSNPNTLLNFFYNHVKNSVNFDLWTKACRNIIDIDDAYLIVDHLLKSNLFPNQVINVANPKNCPVNEIIECIEDHLKVKSNYIEIEKGTCFQIDISQIQPVINSLGFRFDDNYLVGLLQKYYRANH